MNLISRLYVEPTAPFGISIVQAAPVCPEEVAKSRKVKLPLGVFTTYKVPLPGIALAAGICVDPVRSMKYC